MLVRSRESATFLQLISICKPVLILLYSIGFGFGTCLMHTCFVFASFDSFHVFWLLFDFALCILLYSISFIFLYQRAHTPSYLQSHLFLFYQVSFILVLVLIHLQLIFMFTNDLLDFILFDSVLVLVLVWFLFYQCARTHSWMPTRAREDSPASHIIKSFRSHRSFISNPLWTP